MLISEPISGQSEIGKPISERIFRNGEANFGADPKSWPISERSETGSAPKSDPTSNKLTPSEIGPTISGESEIVGQ